MSNVSAQAVRILLRIVRMIPLLCAQAKEQISGELNVDLIFTWEGSL
jgi:hypothetical protein